MFDSKKIAELLVEQMGFSTSIPFSGKEKETSLKCSCGGILVEWDAAKAKYQAMLDTCGKPRYSKKNRLKKKFHKQWMEKHKSILLFGMAMPMCRPGYRCKKCSRHVGFYEAMGRNLFTIEPLPQGALSIYDHDPDVVGMVVTDCLSPNEEGLHTGHPTDIRLPNKYK